MKTLHRVWLRISAVFAALIAAFFFIGTTAYRVSADTSVLVKDFDKTTIIDDLKDFNIADYPKNEDGAPQVIAFMEYCYSSYAFYKEYYGLYFYVYNPTERPIFTTGNKANVAVSYDSEGKPNDYGNVELRLLNATDEKYNNRFFKFKVKNGADFYERTTNYATSNGERRYDVAGIQLAYTSGNVEMDYTYGKTYYFKGYSKGLSAESETQSTLTSRVEGMETLELKVGHTNYRTEDYKDNVCDELNTVYFSVPEEKFAKYGNRLQKIKATWEEYKTSPIFVTNEESAANALDKWVGQDIGNRQDELAYRVLWDKYYDYSLGSDYLETYYTFKGAYNRLTGGSTQVVDLGFSYSTVYHWKDTNDEGNKINDLELLSWIFYREDALYNDGKPNDWSVTADELERYMLEVSERLKDLGQNTVSSDNYFASLFANEIDSDRIELLDENRDGDSQTATRGRITQTIDAGDEQKLLFAQEQSFWDKLFGRKLEFKGESYSPIKVFNAPSELDGETAETFAEKYYVNKNDASYVLNYCKEELKKGNRPVLFRFAQTDYYAANAYFDAESNKNFTSCDGFVAQETMFFEFDIISLTFKDTGGVQTVVPVVSDPIDIINDITPPPDIPGDDGVNPDKPSNGCGAGISWDSIVSFLVSLALLVFGVWLLIQLGVWLISGGFKVVFKVLSVIAKRLLNVLWWLITLPFRFIKKLFRKRE